MLRYVEISRAKVHVIHSLVVSVRDYCSYLHVSLPRYLLIKLPSVINRLARHIYAIPPKVPTTSYLIKLCWLPVKERIKFKICLLLLRQ